MKRSEDGSIPPRVFRDVVRALSLAEILRTAVAHAFVAIVYTDSAVGRSCWLKN
jgi:hypothetical protein